MDFLLQKRLGLAYGIHGPKVNTTSMNKLLVQLMHIPNLSPCSKGEGWQLDNLNHKGQRLHKINGMLQHLPENLSGTGAKPVC